MIDIKDVKVGDTVTFQATVTVTPGTLATFNGFEITDHKPKVELPTEPGIYLAASGLSWELRAEDQNYCRRWFLGGTYMTDTNARLAAPFTRLIPEGSEREQALSDAVRWLEDAGRFTLATDMRDYFGVTP